MKFSLFFNKLKFNCILLLSLVVYSCFPIVASSQEKEICFNIYIITKKTVTDSEESVFEKQKNLLLHQLIQTQQVFDKNRQRNCPEIKISKGIIKQIAWKEARRLSQSVDQDINETIEAYLLRKLKGTSSELKLIIRKINDQPKITYRSLLKLRPGRVIVKTKNALQKLITHRELLSNKEIDNSKELQLTTNASVEKIKLKLDSYGKESSADIIKRARERISKYEKVDQVSASTWSEGELTFWNDLEAQDTSIELKNLLRHYRTPENKCLDIYVVPDGKTPSRHNKEASKNGKWTRRGGAAISSENFPRTTAGKGHAILLTYNTRKSETRLAHELGHLLFGKGDAHEEKKEKDLMHEHSKGGSYLNEIECEQIRENVLEFYGGVTESRKN